MVGKGDGISLGSEIGECDGDAVGSKLGAMEGSFVGSLIGSTVGFPIGLNDGIGVDIFGSTSMTSLVLKLSAGSCNISERNVFDKTTDARDISKINIFNLQGA